MKKYLLFGFLFFIGLPFAQAFEDVPAHSPYALAIDHLEEKGILQHANVFYPDRLINRAEFIKILVMSRVTMADLPPYPQLCFRDVAQAAWYAPFACYAREKGWVTGNAEGFFQPEKDITLAEVVTILARSKQLATLPGFTNWYEPYLASIQRETWIPASFQYVFQPVTRGQMAEILWRMEENPANLPFTDTNRLIAEQCQYIERPYPASMDMNVVQQTWLGWYNGVRQDLGLHPYAYNQQLERSATVWSIEAVKRGSITHKRPGQTAYYDYRRMVNWFADLGLRFQGSLFTENIGWGVYRCQEEDCTDELIEAVRTTFDFYLGEKGKASSAHYDSMVNKYFNEIGLGIAIDETRRRYYLTVHYGSKIISNPSPICRY